jgi:hypothetical protein
MLIAKLEHAALHFEIVLDQAIVSEVILFDVSVPSQNKILSTFRLCEIFVTCLKFRWLVIIDVYA